MRFHHMALAATVCASLAAQSPLTTTYAGGNGLGGNTMMWFDLTVTVGLQVTQLDINAFGGSTAGAIDIYTIAGSHVGNENSATGWTLHDTVTVATPNAVNTPTPCILNTPFLLTPGTYGVAIAYTGGLGQAYTTGPVGPFSNAEMTMVEGGSGGIWTGIVNSPRAFNGSIYYTVGSGFATKAPVGQGCGTPSFNSFYEFFPTTTNDLSNSAFSLINTGMGYTGIQSTTALRGSATATNLNIGDDQEIPVAFGTGTTTMPIPGGSVIGLTVQSNGFVSAGMNGNSWTPTSAAFLGLAETCWAAGWHDLQPAPTGAGDVYTEETATHFYVIYDGVQSWGNPGPGNTMELHFEKGTGNVEYVFGTLDNLGGDYLTGFTIGGASADPGGTDLSDPLSWPVITADPEISVLAFDSDARPVIGTTINMTVSEIPATSVLAAVIYGLGNPNTDLTSFGMPGCFQYAQQDAVVLLFPMSAPTATDALVIPNDTGLVGVVIDSQGAAYDPGNHNALGAITSNGLTLTLDIN